MTKYTVSQAIKLLRQEEHAGTMAYAHITDGQMTSEGRTPDYIHGVYLADPNLEGLPEGQRVITLSVRALEDLIGFAAEDGPLRVDFEGAEAYRTDAGTGQEVPGTTDSEEPAL